MKKTRDNIAMMNDTIEDIEEHTFAINLDFATIQRWNTAQMLYFNEQTGL
jgi:hypothetical protein